ncbi:MAG: hypothetical protein LBJ24_05365 [Treponema sp.]|jgi:hypothetical protein|nr:hypothetical protein [Treponema sp.]
MKVYIFSSKKTPFPGLKGAELLDPKALGGHSPEQGDISYLDLSSLTTAAETKKILSLLKRRCTGGRSPGAAWGIIDPKDSADPAAFFFEGASDYLGSKLLKREPDLKRLKKAASWKSGGGCTGDPAAKKASGEEAETFVHRAAKLPAGKFTG